MTDIIDRMMAMEHHVVADHPKTGARVTIIQPRTLAEAEAESRLWREKHGLDARVVQTIPADAHTQTDQASVLSD